MVIIGEKQDDLRKKGLPCTAKDVSKALSHIKWGSGRDVGEDAAQKVCMIWQRLKHLQEHKGIILSSYALYGNVETHGIVWYSIIPYIAPGNRCPIEFPRTDQAGIL